MATDRLRTSPLDTEHLNTRAMLPERVCDLISAGHTVNVVDRHLVVNDKPDDDSSGYIVVEIETTVEPAADAETMTLFVCHCSHAHHRVFNWSQVGGPEGAAPSDDKHVDRVLRSEKRARDTDDDQETLVPDGGRTLDAEDEASRCNVCGGDETDHHFVRSLEPVLGGTIWVYDDGFARVVPWFGRKSRLVPEQEAVER